MNGTSYDGWVFLAGLLCGILFDEQIKPFIKHRLLGWLNGRKKPPK